MGRIKIGILASAESEAADRLESLLVELAREIAQRSWQLLTGATTGIPDRVSREVRRHGCLSIGISPALNAAEHIEEYGLPLDGCDALIYSGFGLKGRNVILVRSADIVVVIAGGMGTLNEFTIAVDEGKRVGVLTGTGGVADEIERLLPCVRRPELVCFDSSPTSLIEKLERGQRENHNESFPTMSRP
jgi:uncharacterized protein (TIGR00725 family)